MLQMHDVISRLIDRHVVIMGGAKYGVIFIVFKYEIILLNLVALRCSRHGVISRPHYSVVAWCHLDADRLMMSLWAGLNIAAL